MIVSQVHTITVTLDGRLLSPADGFLVRKGPGNCFFDFGQTIIFGNHQHSSLDQHQRQAM